MSSAPIRTKVWYLANKPLGDVSWEGDDATFKLEERDIGELKDDHVLVKVKYVGNDPAQRTWIAKDIDPKRLYTNPVEEGEVMRAYTVCEVIQSKSDKIKEGTLVSALTGWTEYMIIPANQCRPIPPIEDIAPTHFLGALGGTGITAYYGLQVVQAKEGESLVVSGAAGAVGSMVVQIAKHILGLKTVIGLAGTDEKCKWVEGLGADKCINYKSSNWKDQLAQATSENVDIYFDNVGGEPLDFMLTRLRQGGRISACGAIASYQNTDKAAGIKNWFQIVSQRLQVRGFIVMDFFAADPQNGPKTVQTLAKAAKDGKIKIDKNMEMVLDEKFEDIPKVFAKLFEGGNTGKLITELK